MAADVADRLAALRSGTAGARTCLAVRDLVVVCSSSRSGSSMFAELLRRSPDLLTYSAEINPHVTITTLGSGGGCGVLADPTPHAGTEAGMAVLRSELGNDLGMPAARIETAALARHVAWRLTMQWPQEPIDPATVHALLDNNDAGPRGWTNAAFLDLLARLTAMYPSINPYRYDIDSAEVARRFPHHVPPVGPPAEPVVEMAPFVVPRAWQVADASDAARLPVVTTTPRNAFRLPLLAQTFPNARSRVIHLTRNPAAAVNGLRDGWLHSGFFSGAQRRTTAHRRLQRPPSTVGHRMVELRRPSGLARLDRTVAGRRLRVPVGSRAASHRRGSGGSRSGRAPHRLRGHHRRSPGDGAH